jgi:CubicO group peptidase (beta-lactamase class C family)
MALAIEELSGKTFAALLQETIFEPLGMKDTSFVGAAGEDVAMGFIPSLSKGALEPGKGIATGTSPETGIQSLGAMCQGSYSLISSAEDMVSPSLSLADRRPNGSLPSLATRSSPPPLPARLTSSLLALLPSSA